MKRLLMSLLIISVALVTNAQVKKQFQVSAIKNPDGSYPKKWGIYYKPPGISNAKYPVVCFFHGVGEVGTSEQSADNLYTHGPLSLIKRGWKPPYIIIALQDASFSPDPRWYNYILKNDQELKPQVDTNLVLWTGLSAGGGKVLEAAAYGLKGSFIPFSAAWPNVIYDGKLPINSIAFHDPNDQVCPYNISTDFINRVNSTSKGGGMLINMTSGHGGWNAYYDTTYKLSNKQNIYEWAFSDTKPPSVTIDIYPPPPPPPTTLYIDAGRDTIINAPSYTLDASKSKGWKACDWQVISKPILSSNVWYDKQDYTSPIWRANNLVKGEYTFRFYGYSATGAIAYDDVKVTVGSPKVLTHYMAIPVYSDGSRGVEQRINLTDILIR